MVALSESLLKKCFLLALSLVLLGMSIKTVLLFLERGTITETTVKVTDQLPGPSITICPRYEQGIAKLDLAKWDRYPSQIMESNRIKIYNGSMVPPDYQSLYIDIASDIEGTKLLPCVTHYLGGKKAGLKDVITVHVNASSIEGIFLCLHDKTHYIPGWNSLFDTQCIYAQAAPDQKITKEYELKLVERHKLDMEDNPCESKELGSGKMCILEAIQNEIGCRVKVLSKNMSSMSHLNQCTTGEQIGKYGATLLKITNQSQKSLFNLTGCKAPCSQNKWIPVFTGQGYKRSNNNSKLIVFLYFPSGSYKIEKELLIHTWESVVAEFGGYLGLLLGTSIFSMACWLWKSFKTQILKQWPHKDHQATLEC